LHIFERSFESNVLPADWKLANAVPMSSRKKRVAYELNNYRPVSLTCTVCKTFESVVRDTLLEPYLTLPFLTCGAYGCTIYIGRHPALRPQHGSSAHPRQTSRSIEPLWSFGKPQEEKPMDVTQRIQWKS